MNNYIDSRSRLIKQKRKPWKFPPNSFTEPDVKKWLKTKTKEERELIKIEIEKLHGDYFFDHKAYIEFEKQDKNTEVYKYFVDYNEFIKAKIKKKIEELERSQSQNS